MNSILASLGISGGNRVQRVGQGLSNVRVSNQHPAGLAAQLAGLRNPANLQRMPARGGAFASLTTGAPLSQVTQSKQVPLAIISNGVVTKNGGTQVIEVKPDVDVKLSRLIVGQSIAQFFSLTMDAARLTLQGSAGFIICEAFTADADPVLLDQKTIRAGIPISVTVQNNDTADRVFRGMLWAVDVTPPDMD